MERWNQMYTSCITVTNSNKLNSLLYADDQVILGNSGEYLQRRIYTWKNVVQNITVEISVEKYKAIPKIKSDKNQIIIRGHP